MSQSVTLPSSEKSSRQGILRIFRQSVRELGHLTKADSVAHRKESVVCKDGELTENKAVFEKRCTDYLSHKVLSFQSACKEVGKENAANAVEPNNNVETCTEKDFTHSKGRNDHFKQQNKTKWKRWVNKGPIDFSHNKYGSKSDRNDSEVGTGRNNKEKQELLKNVTSAVELKVKEDITFNTRVNELEDWDKEVQNNIESFNVHSLKADLLSSENCVDNLQNDFSDSWKSGCGSVSQTDINNNPIELENAKVFDKNDDITSVGNQELVKSQSEQTATDYSTNGFKCGESTRETIETSVEEFDCIDLETEAFELKKREDFTAGEQFLPFHSTPKKIQFEGHSAEEIEKELGTENIQVSPSLVQLTVKQVEVQIKSNFEVPADKKVSDICFEKEEDSPNSVSNMRRSRNYTRSSDGRNSQLRNNPSQNLPLRRRNNSSEFEKPPRFKTNAGEIGKIEQVDARLMSENIHDFHQKPHRHRFSMSGYERRGSGRTALHDNQSKIYSRNSDPFRNVQEHRKYEQKVHLDSGSCRMSLLDSKIKTPEKFKSNWKGFGGRDNDHRNKVKSPWKMPISEDWTAEIQDLEVGNDELNGRKKEELAERNEQLQYERQEREYETGIVEKYSDNEHTYEENSTKQETVGSDNHIEPYLPPSPPVCWSEKEITVQEESSLKKEIQLEEECSIRKEIVVEEKKTEIEVVEESTVDQQNIFSLEMTDVADAIQAASQTETLYLPPVPVEVIESGDEVSWTNENYGKHIPFDESEISYTNSKNNISICLEPTDESVEITFTVQEERRDFHTNGSSFDNVETEKNRELHKIVANGQNKTQPQDSQKHLNVKEVVKLKENSTENIAAAVDIENNGDIMKSGEERDRKEVGEDSSSLSSIYARRDGACVYSGNGNMTSEADVSDLPFDESKALENDGSGDFCCVKSVEEGVNFESGTLNTEVEQTGFEAYKHAYEQYARYWYEQNSMNADYVQREEFGPWHPNYPYNYEAYRRWCEYVQMNYFWEMYSRQMQCGGQMPSYWCAQAYPCQEENVEMENTKFGNAVVEDKFDVAVEEIETESTENRKERRKIGQCVEKDHQRKSKQLDNAEDHQENAEGIKLTEYWCERMHQWVSQSPEVTKHDHLDTAYLSQCSSEKIGTNLRHVEQTEFTVSVPVDSKVKPAQSIQNVSLSGSEKIVKSKDLRNEKTDHETIGRLDKSSKLEPRCTCKPSQVQFMLWRSCDCEAGKPTKLHKILSSSMAERSFDLGYQSYESLEHDESAVSKQVGGKAPGFVLQPLCSTPATQSSDLTLSKHKKVCTERPEVCKKVGDKSVRNTDKVRPPPGFEGVVYTAQTEKKTGMEDSDYQGKSHPDANRLTQNLLESSSHQKMTSQQPSLKSLIELQNRKYGPEYSDTSGVQGEMSTKKEQNMFPNVNNNNQTYPNMNNMYSRLPACLGNEAQHLSKARLALGRASVAERIQDNLMTTLGSAIQKKITENQKRIEENDTIEEFQGQDEYLKTGGSFGHTLGSANKGKNENKKSETPVIKRQPLRYSSEEKGNSWDSFEVDVNRMPIKDQNRMTSFVLENDSCVVRKTKAKEFVADQSLRSIKYESSSGEYSETSGDENIKFSALSQSPQISANEESNTRASVMVGKLCDYSENENINNYDRQTRNEIPSYDIDDGEIPVNEMMESANKRGKVTTSSEQSPRAELGGANRPRMSCRPRSPYLGLPPPYRTYRPRLRPFSHMEQWPMDPRLLSMPPPPPPQWPPPSTVYQMYGPGFPYGPNTAWEASPKPVYNDSPVDLRMYAEESAKPYARFPQPFPYYHPAERDCCADPAKYSPTDVRNKPSPTLVERNPRKIVEYDSSEESSSEIEPFDVNILRKTEQEINTKCGNQLKPTPKKQKTDTDDASSSIDSIDNNRNENRTKLYGNSTAAFKLSRGHTKKLKQKSLKSFSATDRQPPCLKTRDETPKKMLPDHSKKRSLSGIIAETTSRAFKSDGRIDKCNEHVDVIAQEFPALGSEQEKQLPPFPPLPPFRNSPFWMYTQSNSSGLTGTNEEDEYSKSKSASSTAYQPQRKWLPKSPLRRYSFSPGQASGYSPSETDSDTTSIRSDWKTNFKLFHNFGVEYIDTHCHLDFLFSREGFKGSFKAYMDKHEETFPPMFKGCVAVFCNPNTFTPSGGLWLDVAKEPNVWIAMGCHPKMATDFTAAAELGLKKCLRHSKCIALGEIGLDYSGTFYQHADVQKQVFRRQLKMAVDLEKVLVIHCRQAEGDCLDILKEMVPRKWKIHCHCFTNEYQNAKLWIDAFPNLFIGVTPLVTYRSAKPTHDLARNIPINKLLLETDAPYFVPRCIPKEDLPLSNPGLAVTVAKEIAQYQELTVAAVLRQCRLNTHFMYGI